MDIKDYCTDSFFYVTDSNELELRPEYINIPIFKYVYNLENGKLILAYINLFVNNKFYSQYDDKRRSDIIRNELKIDIDAVFPKEVNIIINKIKEASLDLTNYSISEIENTLKATISMLSLSREKLTMRSDALQRMDFGDITAASEVNIADLLTKIQQEYKFVMDAITNIHKATETLFKLKKSINEEAGGKKQVEKDIMLDTFDN